MARKPIPSTQEQFDCLNIKEGWKIDEVPTEHWNKIPGLQRLCDTIGVLASGCIADSRVLNGIDAVAGIDVLAHESNPKPSETPDNAYHYVVQKTNDPKTPYLLHGPFRSEAIVDHWFDPPQLDRYYQEMDATPDDASGQPAS